MNVHVFMYKAAGGHEKRQHTVRVLAALTGGQGRKGRRSAWEPAAAEEPLNPTAYHSRVGLLRRESESDPAYAGAPARSAGMTCLP